MSKEMRFGVDFADRYSSKKHFGIYYEEAKKYKLQREELYQRLNKVLLKSNSENN